MNNFFTSQTPAKTCIRWWVSLFCGLLLLSGCLQVGPDYKQQEMELPDQWSDTKQSSEKQKTAAEKELARWWTIFEDEELSALIAQTLENNFDIRIAAARIRQTRAESGRASSALGPVLNSN
jgi:outer membrane protein TolC